MARRIPPLDLDNPLLVGAAATHEMFLAYQQVGFSRNEALQLCIAQITAITLDAVQQGETDGSSD